MPRPSEAHLPTNLPKRITTPVVGELSDPNYESSKKTVQTTPDGRTIYGSNVDGKQFVDADTVLKSSDAELQVTQKPVRDKIGTKGRERLTQYEEILRTLGEKAAERYRNLQP